MFEGVKFIPRDQIDKDNDSEDLKKEKKKRNRKKKKSSSRYSSSDEDLDRLKKRSSKKKWYSSDEYSTEESESGGEISSGDEKRRRSRKKGKRRNDDNSGDEKHKKGSKRDRRKKEAKRGDISDDDIGDDSLKEKEVVRKEMGLEWMLRPGEKMDKGPAVIEPEVQKTEEVKVNPRELNPYLKENGSGYPEDEGKAGGSKLLSSSLVGDGGASWRLKALKRAKEQATRDGRRMEEVVEERWGSLGQLAVSVSSNRAAPARAHLHAINSRKRGSTEESQTASGSQRSGDTDKNPRRDYLKDISVDVPRMREPKVRDSLSWGKRKSQPVSAENAGLISDAVSSLNKYSNDGSFMRETLQKRSEDLRSSSASDKPQSEIIETSFVVDPSLSANQLAAKALQLRLKGKHEDAEKLMQEVEKIKAKEDSGDNTVRRQREEGSSRFVKHSGQLRKKKNEDDGDANLAQKIMQNKKFSVSGQADDEYDYDDGPSKKPRKNRGGDRSAPTNTVADRFSMKQEDCTFCYENPKRPSHLVVSVGNFTYLMLPQWDPVVPGHCCILPMQHVQATRSVDEYVWEEIRNFKKCLIMMFAKQEKHVVFLETAVGLAKQRRHCIIECIPMPQEIAEEAPHYFKMEIEEAESEWSQHNAKKLIDTSAKGLRKSIPENIPYFHVEFGLNKGFLHPIDDEREFASNFGINVVRGILKVPEEDMYRRRRRRYESNDDQKQAVQSFARDWAAFDWTKQLHEES